MPDTFQASGVIVVALLPGALYVWSFERIVGAGGIGLSDRVLRFVGSSVVFHALSAPIGYRLWIDFVRSGRRGSGILVRWREVEYLELSCGDSRRLPLRREGALRAQAATEGIGRGREAPPRAIYELAERSGTTATPINSIVASGLSSPFTSSRAIAG
jgi:hypothetical protein